MGQLEDERYRARVLQNMVTKTTTQEERETVIRTIDREIIIEKNLEEETSSRTNDEHSS